MGAITVRTSGSTSWAMLMIWLRGKRGTVLRTLSGARPYTQAATPVEYALLAFAPW